MTPRLERRLRSRWILPACLALWGGCAKPSSDVTTIARDSAGVRIVEVRVTPNLVPRWRLDPTPVSVLTGAETGDETAFAFVGPVRFLQNGGLVIGDVASSRLLIYDEAGDYVRSLGRRGDGPGEIRRLTSLGVLAGDALSTFDGSLRRLSVWSLDSGFVRGTTLSESSGGESWPADAWRWRDSLAIVLQLAITPQDSVPPGAGVRRWPMRAQIWLRDRDGRALAASPSFGGMYSGLFERGDTRLPFSNQPFVATARNRTYFGSGDAFDIRWLDSTFTLAGVIRWPSRDEPLTTAEVEQVRGEAIALISRRPLPANPLAMNFAPEILPRNRPSLGRVFVDRDGNVWAERFEATRLGTALQTPGREWSVLSPTGAPVAILELPARTRLEDVRGAKAVVVHFDSLDVQTVAVHTIRRDR